MEIFRISTGFFIWDVYKWLAVFLLGALVLSFAVTMTLNKRGGRLFTERERRGGSDDDFLPEERFLSDFYDVYIAPWKDVGSCGLFGIAALLLLFVSALFSR